MQNCEKCPRPQREWHFVRIFVRPEIPYNSVFRSERLRVKRWEFRLRHGDNFLYATFAETATLQPRTARQHKTTLLVVTLARPPWVLSSKFETHICVTPDTGSLSWFAHNCNL